MVGGEMPKEKISDDFGGVIAEISWGRDAEVQLATVSTDAATFVAWCRDIVERWDAAKSRHEQANISEGLGMFWTPGRTQINELIRVLRRARDQAYGSDE